MIELNYWTDYCLQLVLKQKMELAEALRIVCSLEAYQSTGLGPYHLEEAVRDYIMNMEIDKITRS